MTEDNTDARDPSSTEMSDAFIGVPRRLFDTNALCCGDVGPWRSRLERRGAGDAENVAIVVVVVELGLSACVSTLNFVI